MAMKKWDNIEMSIFEYRNIFDQLLSTQLDMNSGGLRRMSLRLTTQNFFQVTIFYDGVQETVWNIDSVEKLEKFYSTCKSLK